MELMSFNRPANIHRVTTFVTTHCFNPVFSAGVVVTILFLGAWETLHNPNFKPHEFEGFRNEAGRNSFYMSPKKWVEATGAVGIYSQSGRLVIWKVTGYPRPQHELASVVPKGWALRRIKWN